MTEQEFTAAIARNLYWAYMKDTTGTPGKWSELDEDGRKIWRALAKRAQRKIRELTEAEAVAQNELAKD